MPSKPPRASSTGPPSGSMAAGRSSMIASPIGPLPLAWPWLTRWMAVRRTVGLPSGAAPSAKARPPTAGSMAARTGVATVGVSSVRQARFVAGSRRAARAGSSAPAVMASEYVSSAGSAWSDVTTVSARQIIPAMCLFGPMRIAVTSGAAAATCAARPSDSWARSCRGVAFIGPKRPLHRSHAQRERHVPRSNTGMASRRHKRHGPTAGACPLARLAAGSIASTCQTARRAGGRISAGRTHR